MKDTFQDKVAALNSINSMCGVTRGATENSGLSSKNKEEPHNRSLGPQQQLEILFSVLRIKIPQGPQCHHKPEADLYTSLKPNSLRHSSRMASSSASPMPPYALGSALSLLTWPASAPPKAAARRLASARLHTLNPQPCYTI